MPHFTLSEQMPLKECEHLKDPGPCTLCHGVSLLVSINSVSRNATDKHCRLKIGLDFLGFNVVMWFSLPPSHFSSPSISQISTRLSCLPLSRAHTVTQEHCTLADPRVSFPVAVWPIFILPNSQTLHKGPQPWCTDLSNSSSHQCKDGHF